MIRRGAFGISSGNGTTASIVCGEHHVGIFSNSEPIEFVEYPADTVVQFLYMPAQPCE